MTKMTKAQVKIYANALEVARAFASDLFQRATEAENPLHVALSGGTTPALLFDILAQDYAEKMPWTKLHFWWGDERCVPPSDGQSNYKMTLDHLLSKVDMPAENIHRVMGEWEPAKANEHYIDEIAKYVPSADGWPVFDLIILGMGNDGHTASIFPHEIQLLNDPKVCAVATHPESGQKRVSLTGNVINNAKSVDFLVTGKAKTERVKEIFQKRPGYENLPSSYIQPEKGNLTFYFDEEAAAGIRP